VGLLQWFINASSSQTEVNLYIKASCLSQLPSNEKFFSLPNNDYISIICQLTENLHVARDPELIIKFQAMKQTFY
jgi:hypothetical protein